MGIQQSNPQTLNRYSYCFNNPLTFNDPTGQWPSWAALPTWNDLKEFGKGLGDSVVNIGSAIQQVVSTSGQTVQAMGYAVSHPIQTAEAIGSDYASLMQTQRGQGQIAGQIAITVITLGAASYLSAGGEGLNVITDTSTLTTAETAENTGNQLAFDFMNEPALSGETSGLVIGRTSALNDYIYSPGEYRLNWMDVEDSLGFDANKSVNIDLLQNVIDNGLPIKDISPDDFNGPYLEAERGLLNQSGWSYSDGFWSPGDY